jgi:hypothetical protein
VRLVRGLLALAILAPIVTIGATLAACGVEWFPKCNDPKHPCPDVEPNYPPMVARDGGSNFGPRDGGLR